MKVRSFILAVFLITLQTARFASANTFDHKHPDNKFYPVFIDDSVSCSSLNTDYRSNYLDWKKSGYANELPPELLSSWNRMLKQCPAEFESLYADGVKIMQYRIENEADADIKETLIDSLMLLYDKQIHYFPVNAVTGLSQRGTLFGQKGIDLYTYNDKRFAEAYEFLQESFRLEQSNSDGMAMIYLFRSLIKMVKNEKRDSLSVYLTYGDISTILTKKMAEFTSSGNSRKLEIYKNLRENLDETFEPFSRCTDVIRVAREGITKNPDNMHQLDQLTNFLQRTNCQDDSLLLMMNMRLFSANPKPELAFTIGGLLLKMKRPAEALPFLEDASKSEENELAHDAFLMMATAYEALHNFPASRQKALKAIELNPNDGAAYITIGNLYAASARDCGNDDFSNRTIYWAAVDKFNKALTLDAKVADTAARLIAQFAAQFPKREEIFMHELREGNIYSVECWFTEETKIRSAN